MQQRSPMMLSMVKHENLWIDADEPFSYHKPGYDDDDDDDGGDDDDDDDDGGDDDDDDECRRFVSGLSRSPFRMEMLPEAEVLPEVEVPPEAADAAPQAACNVPIVCIFVILTFCHLNANKSFRTRI